MTTEDSAQRLRDASATANSLMIEYSQLWGTILTDHAARWAAMLERARASTETEGGYGIDDLVKDGVSWWVQLADDARSMADFWYGRVPWQGPFTAAQPILVRLHESDENSTPQIIDLTPSLAPADTIEVSPLFPVEPHDGRPLRPIPREFILADVLTPGRRRLSVQLVDLYNFGSDAEQGLPAGFYQGWISVSRSQRALAQLNVIVEPTVGRGRPRGASGPGR